MYDFLVHSECGLTLHFSGVDRPALPGRVMVVGRWAETGTEVDAAQLSI